MSLLHHIFRIFAFLFLRSSIDFDS